jgi:hypothetical protein
MFSGLKERDMVTLQSIPYLITAPFTLSSPSRSKPHSFLHPSSAAFPKGGTASRRVKQQEREAGQ